jgi:hypothetical protein
MALKVSVVHPEAIFALFDVMVSQAPLNCAPAVVFEMIVT